MAVIGVTGKRLVVADSDAQSRSHFHLAVLAKWP